MLDLEPDHDDDDDNPYDTCCLPSQCFTWVKSKFEQGPSTLTILGIGILIPLIGTIVYSSGTNPIGVLIKGQECPLKNVERVTPVHEMHKSDALKPVPHLQVREAFFRDKRDKVHIVVQVSSAGPSSNPGEKLVIRGDYGDEVKVINTLHTHLLAKRLYSGKTNQTIALHEVKNSGINGKNMSKLLSSVSLLSIKWISYTDPASLMSNSLVENDLVCGYWTTPKVNVMTFPLDKGDVKRSIYNVNPCSKNHCHHHYSEVVIMPMELEKHEDGCQCRKCAAAAASNWLCWVPILGQGCNTFPTARCSLSLHKISWKELFQGCGDEIGSDVKNTTVNKSPYPSHVLLSLLLCH